MPNYRVAVDFVNLRDADLSGFARNSATCFTKHADLFPSPPVSIADLTAATDEFDRAMIAAANGGKILTLRKNEKRLELEQLLRKQATYVQGLAREDLETLVASGFRAVSTNRAQAPLETPRIKKLAYGMSTEFLLTIQRVRNGKSYEVQVERNGQWVTVGVFGTARNIRLKEFTPGQSYTLRVRAVGGSTGYSQWSDPVTRIAL